MFYVIVAINRSKRKEKFSLLFSIIGYLFSCFRINSVFGNVGRGKRRRNDRKCYRLSFCIKVIQKGRNHFPSPRVCNPLTGAHIRELRCGVIFVFISNIYIYIYETHFFASSTYPVLSVQLLLTFHSQISKASPQPDMAAPRPPPSQAATTTLQIFKSHPSPPLTSGGPKEKIWV